MKKIKKNLIIGFFAVASLTILGLVRKPDIYFLIKKNFTIFSDVYREVSLHYVDKVNPEKLIRKGINAMLESLDPYTVLIDESQNQSMEIITRGSYGGVGLDVGYRGGKIVVIAPMQGYPADRKGIRSGDLITKVNGVAIEDMSPEKVQHLTIGEPGTTITLTIKRYGIDQPFTFELKRERIDVKNVAYSGFVGDNKDVGYIMLSRFSQNASEEIREALEDLTSTKELAGLILDLRNNPGGLLDEAVGIVDKFVPQGITVVETRGRQSDHNHSFKTEETPVAPTLPLVILQNGGSASASEIVAGALQDLDRAVIVGEESFGKGLVQTVRPLSYNTALKITTARYYTPSGRSIQSVRYTHDKGNHVVHTADSLKKAFKTNNGRRVYAGDGIAPDVKVEPSPPTLLQTSLIQQNLFFDFANQYAATHDTLTSTMDSNKLYYSFRQFLDKKNFRYKTPAEIYLHKVDSTLNESSQPTETHIKALDKKIKQKKRQAFAEQQNNITKIVYLELATRYKGEKAQAAASLPYDPVVSKAVDVLHDSSSYNNILSISN